MTKTPKTPKTPAPIKLYIPTKVNSYREYDLAFLSTLLALRLSAETGADFIVNDIDNLEAFKISEGICANLDRVSGRITVKYRSQVNFFGVFYIYKIARKWEKFSGSESFPINEPSFGGMFPRDQFIVAGIQSDYPQKEYTEPRKKYFALRLELLDFCIDYLKTQLKINC